MRGTCRCPECEAGKPHRLLKQRNPRERASIENRIERALGEPNTLRVVEEEPRSRVSRVKPRGSGALQPWQPRPARQRAA